MVEKLLLELLYSVIIERSSEIIRGGGAIAPSLLVSTTAIPQNIVERGFV
jgi:hypothetical protein